MAGMSAGLTTPWKKPAPAVDPKTTPAAAAAATTGGGPGSQYTVGSDGATQYSVTPQSHGSQTSGSYITGSDQRGGVQTTNQWEMDQASQRNAASAQSAQAAQVAAANQAAQQAAQQHEAALATQGQTHDVDMFGRKTAADVDMFGRRVQANNDAFTQRLGAIRGLQTTTPGGPAEPGVDPNAAAQAQSLAFARQKDMLGQNNAAAVQALQGIMAGRGLRGSSIEAGAMGDIVGGGAPTSRILSHSRPSLK